MKNVKVSVIVPCYNVEKHLDRCMDSLLHQTLRDIEIILVDDGSPDRVPQMVDEYGQKDARVRVIHKDNGGLGFARNSGLDIAVGEYVAFVDSDDFVEKDMYEMLYTEASTSGADAVFSNFFVEAKPGVWNRSQEVAERKEWNGKEIETFMLDMIASAPYERLERKFKMSVWHAIYRRDIIENWIVRFRSEREVLSEDFPFQMDCLGHSDRVVYIPQAFYHYCLNESSLTHTFNSQKFMKVKALYDLLAKQLENVSKAQERLDRFYIGYMRSRTLELLSSAENEKKAILEKTLKDDFWEVLRKRYPSRWLPLYAAIFYYLSAHQRTKSLIFYAKCVSLLKRCAAQT